MKVYETTSEKFIEAAKAAGWSFEGQSGDLLMFKRNDAIYGCAGMSAEVRDDGIYGDDSIEEFLRPLYLCLAMSNSQSVERSAGLIADAPICEGVEGVEFSAEQLAGQWAADYAMSSDTKLSDIDEDTLDAYLDIVEEHCQEEGVTINFSHAAGLAHALKIVRAYQANEEPELAFL